MTFKWKIDPLPPDGAPPYTHLEPIIDALVEAGNEIAGPEKFYLARDGWLGDLRNPIDFALVRQRFELPPTIELWPTEDSILCRYTWTSIRGGITAPEPSVDGQRLTRASPRRWWP